MEGKLNTQLIIQSSDRFLNESLLLTHGTCKLLKCHFKFLLERLSFWGNELKRNLVSYMSYSDQNFRVDRNLDTSLNT